MKQQLFKTITALFLLSISTLLSANTPISTKEETVEILKKIKSSIPEKKLENIFITSTNVINNNLTTGKWTKIDYKNNKEIKGSLLLISNSKIKLNPEQKLINNTRYKIHKDKSGELFLDATSGEITVYCSGSCGCALAGTFPPFIGKCTCQDCTLTVNETT